jgi:MFS family permease
MSYVIKKAVALFFIITILSAGYYFNITLIQLGLHDFGLNYLELNNSQVANYMGFLSVATAITSLISGYLIYRKRELQEFRKLLWMLLGVLVTQSVLVWSILSIRSISSFYLWILFCSISLGLAIPVTYTLFYKITSRNKRYLSAAIITGVTYFVASTIPIDWSIENFVLQFKYPLVVGVIALGTVQILKISIVNSYFRFLKLEYSIEENKYLKKHSRSKIRYLFVITVLLLATVFFVDSLGFIRLISTPEFIEQTWQSESWIPRISIGIGHILGAIVGAIMYKELEIEKVIVGIMLLFGVSHLALLISQLNTYFEGYSLMIPFIYAFSVSVYTVLNFVVWPDFSSGKNVSMISAIGVAIGGWFSTFISTSLALNWISSGMSFETHIRNVNSVIVLVLIFIILYLYLLPVINKFNSSRL